MRTRYRARVDRSSLKATFYGVPGTYIRPAYHFAGKTSSWIDDVAKPGRSRFYKQRNIGVLDHYKVTSSTLGSHLNGYSLPYGYGVFEGDLVLHNVPETLLPYTGLPTLFTNSFFNPPVPRSVETEFSLTAAKDMYQHVKEGLNVITFVAEIGDLLPLAESMAGRVLTLKEYLSKKGTLKERLETPIGRLKSTRVGDVADLKLEWDFAISPTLSDGKALFNAQIDILKKIEDLKRNFRRKGSRISTTRNHQMGPSEESVEFSVGMPKAGLQVKRIKSTYQLTAGTYVYPNLDMLDTLVGQLSVAFRHLGLSNPLGAVWNLLPFSFVVDYFFPVGDIISHYAGIDRLPGWKYRGTWYTVKAYHDFEVKFYTPYTNMVLGHFTTSSMKRRTALPSINLLDLFDKPDEKQTLLIAALLGSGLDKA